MVTLREAQVIDINDPDKAGKIKIRILPEMELFKVDVLPWVGIYHEGTGITSTQGVHILPEQNSFIRVLIEDWPHLRKIRVISDDYVEGIYIYNNTSLTQVTDLTAQTYPQPFFKKYKDGTIEFHNTSSGEYGVLYKGGEYEIHDATGNYLINVKTNKLKFYNNTTSLKSIILDLKTLITHMQSTSAFLDGESRPCTYTQTSSDATLLSNLATKINSLLLD